MSECQKIIISILKRSSYYFIEVGRNFVRIANFVYLLVLVSLVALTSCANASNLGTQTSKSVTTTTIAADGNYVPPPVKYDRSCEKSAFSSWQMDQCAESELSQVTDIMNSALSKEAKYIGSGVVTTVQSSWEKYMLAECDMEEGIFAGGSTAPYIQLTCEASETVARIKEIDRDIFLRNP